MSNSRVRRISGIVVVGALLFACGASDHTEVSGAMPEMDIADTEGAGWTESGDVLHEFEVQGVTYTIIDIDADRPDGIALRETGPLTVDFAPYARLMQDNPDLTLLEAFLTLAPQGSEPRARLVDYHAYQTSARGRDPAIRRVDFDFDYVTTKSVGACEDLAEGLLFNVHTGFRATVNATCSPTSTGAARAFVYTPGGQSSPTLTKNSIATAACNGRNAFAGVRIARVAPPAELEYLFFGSIAPYTWTGYYLGDSTTERTLAADITALPGTGNCYASGAYETSNVPTPR